MFSSPDVDYVILMIILTIILTIINLHDHNTTLPLPRILRACPNHDWLFWYGNICNIPLTILTPILRNRHEKVQENSGDFRFQDIHNEFDSVWNWA